jgi:hypothetical protein
MKPCTDQHDCYHRLMNAYWVLGKIKNSPKFKRKDQQVLREAQADLYYAMEFVRRFL